MIETQCNQCGKKIIHNYAEAPMDMLQLFDRRRFRYIENSVKHKTA